jgi:hypothetical protein
MQKTNYSPIELSNWIAYYKILVEDIRYAKNQQWRLTYYIVLLLAALIGLSELFKRNWILQTILIIAAILLAIFGTRFLCKFQKDLTRYRSNIGKIRKKFPGYLHDIAKFEPAEGNPTYYVSFLSLLIGVIWVSVFLVACAVILKIAPCL